VQISGSVALVTGGASGLGEATVRNHVEQGGKAAILDLSEELGKKLAAEMQERVIFVKTDITKEESVQYALDKIIDSFGAVHILVNCAGIGFAQKVLGKKGIHSLKDFDRVVQINLVGSFNTIRFAAEKMTNNTPNEEGERGVIINTASVAAYEGQVGQAAYSASKSGVVGMTLPIARELAEHGIRVVTIVPGLFGTPMFATLPEKVIDALGKMTPFPQRLGHPIEYANLVQSIIENPMLNGTSIRLDGAIRMQPR